MSNPDHQQRLKAIFSAILEIPVEAVVPELSPQGCAKWDSLNQIHLVNGIEEEFGFQMNFEDQMRLMSFAVAQEIVAAQQA